MTGSLEFHPISEIFPLIEGKEFDDLVADVRKHGIREPIWLYQGKILDGRNRYLAAQSARVPCPHAIFDEEDPVAFVISLNLKRRHLDESQRGMAGAKLANMRQGARTDIGPIGPRSNSDAAKLMNVGTTTVKRSKKVLRDGDRKLIEAVERGDISVSTGANIASLPKKDQRAAIAGGEEAVVRAAHSTRSANANKKASNITAVAINNDLLKFYITIEDRLQKLANTTMPEETKSELIKTLYVCADGFARLAQVLDGR
jgi:ParB-like chromosome segregation protein Spo0J